MSVESLTSLLTGGISAIAVMAIFLTLILTGRLHTESEFERAIGALDKEKTAHEETRRALTEAGARADAAVRASEMIAAAFAAAKDGHHVP